MHLSLSCNFHHEPAGSRLSAQVSLKFYLELACYVNLEVTCPIADCFMKEILLVVDDSHYTCTSSWGAKPFHDVHCSQSAGVSNMGVLLYLCPPIPPPQRMLTVLEFRSEHSKDFILLSRPSVK
jgi:hypothetical protein